MKKRAQPHLYRYFIVYFIIITLAIMLTYALMTNTANNLEYRKILMIPLLFTIFVITNIFALYLLKNIYILNRKNDKIKMELIKYQYLESDLKLYRQHRHDMKNHLSIMYELVKDQQYEDLENYTLKYMQKTSNKLKQIHTGVDELDILLYNKMDQAKNYNIPVEYYCKTDLYIHSNAVIDIISIISNLLDNAIDACKTLDNPNERMISINIEEDQLDVVFVITNSFLTKKNPDQFSVDGFTTKSDKANHGLGLGIIHQLVERYKGKVSLEIFNNKFYQVKIELPKHLL